MNNIKKQIALTAVTGASLIVSAMGWAKAASITGQFELRYSNHAYGCPSNKFYSHGDNICSTESFSTETESGRQALAKIGLKSSLSGACVDELAASLEHLRHDARAQESISKVAALANASSWKVIGDMDNKPIFNLGERPIRVSLYLVLFDAQGRNITARLPSSFFLEEKKPEFRITSLHTCWVSGDLVRRAIAVNFRVYGQYLQFMQTSARRQAEEDRRQAEGIRREAELAKKVTPWIEQGFGSPTVGETGPARRSPAVASGQSIKSSLPNASGGRATNTVEPVSGAIR